MSRAYTLDVFPKDVKDRILDFHEVLMIGSLDDPDLKGNYPAELITVHDAYLQGVHRIRQITWLLYETWMQASQIQWIVDRTYLEETGDILRPRKESHLSDDDESKIRTKVSLAERDFVKTRSLGDCYPGFGVGSNQIASIAARWDDKQRYHSLRSFYESIVILGWSIFENIAEDLWVSAVNARPSKLAIGKVSVDALKMRGFQIADKMGEILSSEGSYSFRSLHDIRDSYKATFQHKGGGIVAVLDDKELDHVAAIRNVLIHKGGKIDREYLKRVAGIPSASRGKVGDILPLDGKTTAARVNAALHATVLLVNQVSAWIRGNPEQSHDPSAKPAH